MRADVGRASVRGADGRARAARLRAARVARTMVAMRAVVVEETWVRATVAVWRVRPGVLQYVERTRTYRVVRVSAGATYAPELASWLRAAAADVRAADRAADAARAAAAAENAQAGRAVLEFRDAALQRGGLPVGGAALGAAFAAANFVLVAQAFSTENMLRSSVEGVGATLDAIYATEFFVEMSAVAARQGSAALGAVGATGRLVAVRAAGFLGALVSVGLNLTDFVSAINQGEGEQALGYGLSVAGNLGIAAVIIAATPAGAALGGTVVGSAWFGPAAVLLVLIGGGIVWYYKSQELRRFLQHSHWGTRRATDSVAKQLDTLLHLLAGPEVTAREDEHLDAPSGTSARGRYGLAFTIRPWLFIPETSALSVNLQLRRAHVGGLSAAGNGGASPPVWLDVPGANRLSLDVGPLTPGVLEAAQRGEVRLTSGTARGADGAAAPAVTVDLRNNQTVFRMYVPLTERHRLTERGRGRPARTLGERVEDLLAPLGGTFLHSARGQATLQLWAPARGTQPAPGSPIAALSSRLRLQPFELTDLNVTTLR